MPPDFPARLHALAEVVVRVGLNLQPGQPLLITDPYDLLGVHPDALPLADAVKTAAVGASTTILTADPAQLRALMEGDDQQAYMAQVSQHTSRLRAHLDRGGAFLFITGTAPRLFAGVPAERRSRFDVVKWRFLGPVIQQLIRGASQWTLVPAPTSDWAALAGVSVPALWETLFAALRIDSPSRASQPSHLTPLQAWQVHLAGIAWQCEQLNATRHRRIRYRGPGTDLYFELPRFHRWCTAQLTSRRGVPFVVNLPTEEIFTAPDRSSATGHVRVARAVAHGGEIMRGIEIEFRFGRAVAAKAESGEDYLLHLLATDRGAARIGEVAMVPQPPGWAAVSAPPPIAGGETAGHPSFYHTLLDENAAHHVALGDAYRFCSRAWLPWSLNSSLIHVDLPLDATVELS